MSWLLANASDYPHIFIHWLVSRQKTARRAVFCSGTQPDKFIRNHQKQGEDEKKEHKNLCFSFRKLQHYETKNNEIFSPTNETAASTGTDGNSSALSPCHPGRLGLRHAKLANGRIYIPGIPFPCLLCFSSTSTGWKYCCEDFLFAREWLRSERQRKKVSMFSVLKKAYKNNNNSAIVSDVTMKWVVEVKLRELKCKSSSHAVSMMNVWQIMATHPHDSWAISCKRLLIYLKLSHSGKFTNSRVEVPEDLSLNLRSCLPIKPRWFLSLIAMCKFFPHTSSHRK